jgi:hypothetical protein
VVQEAVALAEKPVVARKPSSTPPKDRESASCTDRQIYWSVRHGRRCTFRVLDAEPVTGYVAGADRYNYFVVWDQDGRIRRALVHKGSVSVIELHEESALEGEPQRELLVSVIGPFRKWVMRSHFNQS